MPQLGRHRAAGMHNHIQYAVMSAPVRRRPWVRAWLFLEYWVAWPLPAMTAPEWSFP